MRIAFVGKGGSGKSSLSSVFARYLAQKSLDTIIIDGDINQHLNRLLNISDEKISKTSSLSQKYQELKNFIIGTNPKIQSPDLVINTTPPGVGSNLIELSNLPDFLNQCVIKSNENVKYARVGDFEPSDIAVKCFHAKISALDLILSHLIDKPNQYFIADLTAGSDSFASGIFAKFDFTFLIVEPTTQSISVYNQYKNYAKDYELNIKVIGNKIEDLADLDFITENLGFKPDFIIPKSTAIKNLNRGAWVEIQDCEPELTLVLEKMYQSLQNYETDWDLRLKYMNQIHIKNALGYGNMQKRSDLTTQVDPGFNFLDMLND